MKTLTSKSHVSIQFGEWFDKTAGNTYYDALVCVDGESFQVPYQYGYNAGSRQSIDEALKAAGYRLRVCSADRWRPYRQVHTFTTSKLKRELFTNG